MKKITIFFLLLSISIEICNLRFLRPKEINEKDNIGKKNNDKPPRDEYSLISLIIKIIFIIVFILLFIFLLVYFIITKFNSYNRKKQNDFYVNIKELMKLKGSKISNNSFKKIDASDSSNLIKSEDLNCPSVVNNEKNKLNIKHENKKETDFTNEDDNIDDDLYDKKIIKPSEEDLKLYKPYNLNDNKDENE
jgi:hypothetical protein